MFKLLTRFAWCVSYLIWFLITFSFAGFLEDTRFRDEEMFVVLIFTVLFGMLFKKMFLSENFILSRLDFFAEWIEKRLLHNQENYSQIETQEKNNQLQPLQQKEEIQQEPVVLETIDTQDHISEYNSPDYEDTETTVQSEPSKIALYMKQFFSENLLAKIGAILVFLWVVFLMSLIWNQIPATGKILIGFTIGFWIYFAWVKLDKKWYIWESRILLWTWILINFLVILTWKYILNFGLFNLDANELWFLATWATLLFLVLNTIFWVVTSLVYNSRTLLLFSFIFAYINPFLTGWSMDTPYTMIGYSLLVSMWAIYTAIKQNDIILKYWAFILWNILLLVAPSQTEIWWISVLIASAILWIVSIYSFVKNNPKQLNNIFIGNYVVIILLLISGWDIHILSQTWSFISYMISILLFFGIWIWLFVKQLFHSIISILIFPILIILGLIFTGAIDFVTQSLWIIVLFYLIAFSFIQNVLNPTFKYIFFFLLWGFIFMVNSFSSFEYVMLNLQNFIITAAISFVFLFTAYYLSCKKNLEFLYSIGTIGGIFILAPIVDFDITQNFSSAIELTNPDYKEIYKNISIALVTIFAISNLILPFINKQLTDKYANIKNILLWSIFGVLFIGFQLFNYGDQYFPGFALGLSFGWLAILYFILSYVMMNKLWVKEVKSEKTYKNIVLHYLFISISLFSLAIALIFANNPEIISTVWLFEATILFYFFNQTKEEKIWILWLVLFIIWILQLFDLSADKHQYIFLIPIWLILSSFVYNLKNLHSLQNGPLKILHDIFHILWIWVITILLLDIIPSTGHGWSTIWISLFILILGIIYSNTHSSILKVFFIITLALFSFIHIESVENILSRIDRNWLEYLRILQYGSFWAIASSLYFWNKYNKKPYYNKFTNGIFVLYSLAIVSFFVYDIFSTTFAITIFWWVLASIILFFWINSDTVKTRTIGLYLLALVLWKIFIYDIWYLDNAVTRVVALMIIGILLIVISIKYTEKYGNNLLKEFDPKNLFSNENDTIISNNEEKVATNIPLVNKHIGAIDVDDINSIKFYPNWDKTFISKAKNLKKIVRMILEEKPCGTFAPNELLDTYNYIIDNYKTELSKRDFDLINWAIQNFVKKWWKVEIKK